MWAASACSSVRDTGDLRCDNIFRKKQKVETFANPGSPRRGRKLTITNKEYAYIDWQGLAMGCPGVDMLQLLSASMADVNDYDKLDVLLEHYYREMTDKSPAWVRTAYTYEHLVSDFGVLMALLLTSGTCVLFLPMIPSVPNDHPLITLASIWPPRIGAAMMKVDSLKHVKALLA